ncbi:MAG: Swt1 family HEPN domain-containing protein [Acidimicrobiaceae bacterium]|nr:Swt1 family HEPN domain-containing protein [Acidimicrobiaceae bacterium]
MKATLKILLVFLLVGLGFGCGSSSSDTTNTTDAPTNTTKTTDEQANSLDATLNADSSKDPDASSDNDEAANTPMASGSNESNAMGGQLDRLELRLEEHVDHSEGRLQERLDNVEDQLQEQLFSIEDQLHKLKNQPNQLIFVLILLAALIVGCFVSFCLFRRIRGSERRNVKPKTSNSSEPDPSENNTDSFSEDTSSKEQGQNSDDSHEEDAAEMDNSERLRKALRLLSDGLGPTCKDIWETHYDKGWLQTVNGKLRQPSRQPSINDPAWLLQSIIATWDEVFEDQFDSSERPCVFKVKDACNPLPDSLPTIASVRSLVFEIKDARNRWAHPMDTFSSDDTIRALDSMERLLEAFGNSEQRTQIHGLRYDLMSEIIQ